MPGPGAYDLQNTSSKIGFRMTGRNFTEKS